MQYTGNYSLKKPDGTDVVNIADFNDNADVVDVQLQNLNNNKVTVVTGKALSTNDYTSAEKTKLTGIATGANNYVHPATHPSSIIAQDASNRFVSDTEKATWNAKASTAIATTTANGLMDSADKLKLNGIAAGAQVNATISTSTTSTSTTTVASSSAVKAAMDTANSKQNVLTTEQIRKITFGTAEPTGGVDGDIYFQYE